MTSTACFFPDLSIRVTVACGGEIVKFLVHNIHLYIPEVMSIKYQKIIKLNPTGNQSFPGFIYFGINSNVFLNFAKVTDFALCIF